MAAKNYDEIRQLIINTLEGRPAGTMIYPEGHQEIDLSILDFANAISSVISTGIAGEAQGSTQPIQPSGSNVAYIFQVAPNSAKTFTNFRDSGGNVISVTTNSSQAAVGFLLWNGSYWSAMTVYIAVTSPAFETISSDIIQLLDGETPVYPITKAEAVFLNEDPTKTVEAELSLLGLKSNEFSYNFDSLKTLGGVKQFLTPVDLVNKNKDITSVLVEESAVDMGYSAPIHILPGNILETRGCRLNIPLYIVCDSSGNFISAGTRSTGANNTQREVFNTECYIIVQGWLTPLQTRVQYCSILYSSDKLNLSIEDVWTFEELYYSDNQVRIDRLAIKKTREDANLVIYADGNSSSHQPKIFTFDGNYRILVIDTTTTPWSLKQRSTIAGVLATDYILLVYSTVNNEFVGGALLAQYSHEAQAIIEEEVIDKIVTPTEVIITSAWTNNQGINYTNGRILGTSTTKASGYIPISGLKIRYPRIKFTSASGVNGIAFFGENYDYISGINSLYGQDEAGVVDYVAVVPQGAKYVRFAYRTTESTEFYLYDYIPISDTVENLSEEVDVIKDTIGDFETTEKTTAISVDSWINGKYVYSSGSAIGGTNSSSVNSASDFVDLSGFSGMTLRYTRMKSTASQVLSGLCFYDKDKVAISGVDTLFSQSENAYYLFDVPIPVNARYARFTMRTEWLSDFSAAIYEAEHKTFVSGLGFDVQNLEEEVAELQSQVTPPETHYSPLECRRRFYTEMNDWCTNHGIIGAIIEGPSGYGAGGEVENEVLGHGMSSVPLSGMGKVMAASLNYEQLNTIWQRDTYTIKTKAVVQTITFGRSLDNHYGSVIEQDYTILGWKTGSSGGLTNLMVAVTNAELNGNVLVGVMSRNYQADTAENNRSLATKYLLDIGVALYKDRDADISSLESLMLAQHAVHAIVFICPQYPAFLHKWDILNDEYHSLYVYSEASINTMSMIKVLVAQIVIDYVPDLDELVTIIQDDITAATGGTGAIFANGEQVTYRDLLCALLMPSSNQAGYVLARKVGQILLDRYGDYSFIPSGS